MIKMSGVVLEAQYASGLLSESDEVDSDGTAVGDDGVGPHLTATTGGDSKSRSHVPMPEDVVDSNHDATVVGATVTSTMVNGTTSAQPTGGAVEPETRADATTSEVRGAVLTPPEGVQYSLQSDASVVPTGAATQARVGAAIDQAVPNPTGSATHAKAEASQATPRIAPHAAPRSNRMRKRVSSSATATATATTTATATVLLKLFRTYN